MNEGLSISALAEKANLSLSTASRIVGALAKQRQKGHPYGLVRVEISREEKRRKELYMSVKGKAFMNSIAELMEEKNPQKQPQQGLRPKENYG